MNKAQLRQRTRQLSGTELDGLRDDPELDLLIEESYREICAVVPFKWREVADEFSTVVDQTEYTIPSTVDEAQGFAILDASGTELPVPLHEVPIRDLLNRIRRDDSKLPRFYSRTGVKKVRLGPAPDKVYTVEVFGLAPLAGLPLDTSEPEFLDRFHPAIAYHAAAVLLDEEGQDELAARRRERAQVIVSDMIDYYQLSKDYTPIQRGGGQLALPLDRLGRLRRL